MPQVFRRRIKYRDKNGNLVAGRTDAYYARFQLNGRDYCVSTGKTTEKEAQKELGRLIARCKGQTDLAEQVKTLRAAILAPATDPEAKEEWLPDRRRLLSDWVEPLFMELLQVFPEAEREQHRRRLVKKLQGGQKDKLPIKEGWKAWLQSPNKRNTPKDRTLQGYEAIWDRFSKWAGTQGIVYLHRVDARAAQSYAEDLWTSRVSPSTFNAHIKFLTSMFKALEVKAGLTENVWGLITRKAKPVDQGRRNLTEGELRKVMGAAKGNLRIMLAIGLFTGLRLGDVVNLRRDEIDHDRFKGEARPGFIVTKPMKTSRYGTKVEIPITPFLRQVLDQHQTGADGEYLFPGERQDYLQNTAKLTKQIQDLFVLCGIKTVEEPANQERRRAIVRVGFHSLRHSFVSLCAKAGAPQHIVQKLVGHSSPAMTEHYTHVADEEKRVALGKLPDFVTEVASDGVKA